MDDRTKPVSVDLEQLAAKLREGGMDITADQINLETDASLETPENAEKLRQQILASFAGSGEVYDEAKPSLNFWQRACIAFRLNR